MSNPTPILDGVFAINKPAGISSAQVLRDLQTHFNPSKTFAPWIENERRVRTQDSHNQHQKRSRRQRQAVQVKLGHGGTLDPAATGVLIVGVGTGTKKLQGFLECTKAYEATVLFGAATDTYDGEGKIVKRAAYEGVSEPLVEEALGRFRGEIKQVPPIYSALRVQGKRLYEYAREGKELPQKIAERSVTVSELVMREWMQGGTHEHRWPEREADKEEKEIMDRALHLDDKLNGAAAAEGAGTKRKPEYGVNADATEGTTPPAAKRSKTSPEPAVMSGAIPEDGTISSEAMTTVGVKDGGAEGQEAAPPAQEASTGTKPESEQAKATAKCPAPAALLHMTVSSGFYVRSLCHDLGLAVGSLAFMSSLVRSRQGDFVLGENVLEYTDLAKGEDVWGPKVVGMLAQWAEEHGEVGKGYAAGPAKVQQPQEKKQDTAEKDAEKTDPARRRNTSSAEE